jgi:ribosome recycling factor
MGTEDVLADSKHRMEQSVESVERELTAIRTGHAHTGLVESIKVEFYGTTMPMNQMATVAAPEARLITIQPWDKGALTAIEKALLKIDLGLTPANDGAMIRLSIPPLTEARRKEMIKLVHARVESGHVAVRNVRRDAIEQMRKAMTAKEISEDDQRRGQEQLQKLTDQYIAQINARGKDKEAELMEV